MDTEELKEKVKDIVRAATSLRRKHVRGESIPVNYACIFSQDEQEYKELVDASGKIGKVIDKTPTGPVFQINPLQTVSGTLKLLKIRTPDVTRPERGDADFTVPDFYDFEKEYIHREGFKLIQRQDFSMIELLDPSFDVRAYFSNPPLDEQLGIK